MAKNPEDDGPKGGFRQRLFRLRADKGWSQSDLARRVWGTVEDSRGYTVAKNRDRISAYEAGRAVPERANLTSIAEALGVSVEELAPDLVMANPQRGTTALFTISMAPDMNEAHIKVDAILPMGVALKIINALDEYARTRAANGEGV